MDDRFLHEHRREPRPGFVRALREKLREQSETAAEKRGFQLHPALAGAVAVAMVAGLFSLPAVRAKAGDLLSLFRVQNLTAVPFDPSRLERLKELVESESGGPAMLGFDTEVLRQPGEPREFPTPEAASSAAGLSVRTPNELPRGFTLDKIVVTSEAEARMTANTTQLDAALDLLDIRDMRAPSEWNGRSVTLRMPRAVSMQYVNGDRRAEFKQAASPEVDLPPGADLAQMGVVALRVLGLSADEAKRTASRIDWNSTLLVPVPIDATAFREVTIHGHKGLLIETTRPKGGGRAGGGLVLWTEQGRVYAIGGNVGTNDLVVMAESVR